MRSYRSFSPAPIPSRCMDRLYPPKQNTKSHQYVISHQTKTRAGALTFLNMFFNEPAQPLGIHVVFGRTGAWPPPEETRRFAPLTVDGELFRVVLEKVTRVVEEEEEVEWWLCGCCCIAEERDDWAGGNGAGWLLDDNETVFFSDDSMEDGWLLRIEGKDAVVCGPLCDVVVLICCSEWWWWEEEDFTSVQSPGMPPATLPFRDVLLALRSSPPCSRSSRLPIFSCEIQIFPSDVRRVNYFFVQPTPKMTDESGVWFFGRWKTKKRLSVNLNEMARTSGADCQSAALVTENCQSFAIVVLVSTEMYNGMESFFSFLRLWTSCCRSARTWCSNNIVSG